jgi:carotenoid cleavage dioxygenase
VRWFKGPASVVMHTINAFDDGNKVIVDAPISDGNPFPFFPQVDGSPWSPQLAQPTAFWHQRSCCCSAPGAATRTGTGR